MFFVDDGFSGTNFDRPDWQRLMTLVDEGKVDMLMLWRLTPRVETGTSQLPVGHQRRAFLNTQGSRLVKDDSAHLGSDPAQHPAK